MFSNTNIFIGLYNKLSIVARMFVEIIYTFPKDHIHIIKLGYSSSVMSEWTLPQTNEDISKASTKSSEMYRAGNLLDQVKPTQLCHYVLKSKQIISQMSSELLFDA